MKKINSKKIFVFASFDVAIVNFCYFVYLGRMTKYAYYIDVSLVFNFL
jgi:hypothetical protein